MSSRSERKLERYPLPPTVDSICTLIRDVLNGGHVGRIELDTSDAYVRAWRFVEKDEMSEPEVNWDGALRNLAVMMEYVSERASPFQTLVDVMLLAQEEKLKGVAWAVGFGGKERIRQWLCLKERDLLIEDIGYLLGVPIIELKSLPEDTLILCCSVVPNADPSEVTFAIKTAIELRSDYGESKGNGQDFDRSRNYSPEHSPTVDQLATGPRGLHSVLWEKKGKARL